MAAETYICDPSEKFVCSSQGCKMVPAKVRAVIDIDKRSYSRCDSNGCDKYEASIDVGGIYLNISVPRKSLVAKIEIPSLGGRGVFGGPGPELESGMVMDLR